VIHRSIALAACLLIGVGLSACACSIDERVAAIEKELFAVRTPPLRDLGKIDVTISVADFGARPDDAKDDLPAFIQAIAAAGRAKGNCRIVLPNGSYTLTPPAGGKKRFALEFNEQARVILDGQGSSISITTPTVGFVAVLNSSRVILCNYTLDYNPPPHCQGFVTAVDREQHTFDYRIDEGFPLPDDRLFGSGGNAWGMLQDPRIPGKLKAHYNIHYPVAKWESIEGRTYRGHLAHSRQKYVNDFKTGDAFIYISRLPPAHFTAFSKDITFSGITIHTSPGGGFVGQRCERVNVLDCHITPKEGRLHTSNADAFHFQAFRVGPWIEGCTVQAIADDVHNFYAVPLFLQRLTGSSTAVLCGREGHLRERAFVGDPVALFDPRAGRTLLHATLTGFDPSTGAVSIDKPWPKPLQIGRPHKLPNGRRNNVDDTLYSCGALTSYFVVRNNTFRYNRRYGGFVKSHHGLIENNRYIGQSGDAIRLANGPDWPEGFAPQKIIVRGNHITECAYEGQNRHSRIRAVISAAFTRRGHKPAHPGSRDMNNIFILDNTIDTWQHCAIRVVNGTDVVIRGNTMTNVKPYPYPSDDGPVTPIGLTAVSNAIVRDNIVRDNRKVAGPVVADKNCKGVISEDNPVQESERQ